MTDTKLYKYLNTGEIKTKSEWVAKLSLDAFDSLAKYGGMKLVKKEVMK